ncbi:hypothetical protein [Allomuricauda sp. d1]|uniref:hypothetical protein n=1 Tax=Allomuricauda sp. d1 TaxID=3136725 RepID=UPI0031DB5BF7
MRTITYYVVLIIISFLTQQLSAQKSYEKEVEELKNRKEEIVSQEKDALRLEVEHINKQLEKGKISAEEATKLKEAAAKKRALNIENRTAIIDNRIALLERNQGQVLELDSLDSKNRLLLTFDIDDEDDRIFGIRINERDWDRDYKYDRRTYSDLVLAIGLNNALIEGQSLDDSPYKIGGSRFFEMGWQWRTRVFRNSNWLRFNYGFSFQFNGLKPENNQFFVQNGDQTGLQEFDVELDKSKLRMDNLVFPVHFEIGPSKYREYRNGFRYSLDDQFRLGFGGYAGFNLGTRQKLKYTRDGERVKDKFKRDYNTSDLIYGLSAYAGIEGVLLYVKYDLNPIFRDAPVEQRNISLGVRFDL